MVSAALPATYAPIEASCAVLEAVLLYTTTLNPDLRSPSAIAEPMTPVPIMPIFIVCEVALLMQQFNIVYNSKNENS